MRFKIIKSFGEFEDITYPISFEEFDKLEIKPDTAMGFFRPHRLLELENFCAAHPQYHIIS